jgi:hypothetical protein
VTSRPGSHRLDFRAPDHDFEVAHLKSGNNPDVRTTEGNHYRAAIDAAQPMWAGIVEDLQTIRGPGEATPDARMVGGLARRQQHAHHPGGVPKR